MPDSISKADARKLILLSQGLPPRNQTPKSCRAADATLAAIEQIGYVQIDTISVIKRAHHHTLWNRVPGYAYTPTLLDQLLEQKKVFEYWSHAAAYLPMRDYRFSLIRKHAIAAGRLEHWYDRDPKLEKFVLKRIAEEGPLMAKDFDKGSNGAGKNSKTMDWSKKPAKKALENLFMQGDLMVPRRVNFHKVYDLRDRVLDDVQGGVAINTSEPSETEYQKHLVTRFLQANGLGQAKTGEMSYLLKNTKSKVARVQREMLEAGELIEILVDKRPYVALPATLQLLQKPLMRKRLKILSPFDNLLIQRRRIQELFDFDYQIECYVPEKKRRFGYFALPILWDGRLVARMDCKVNRSSSKLHILNLALEENILRTSSRIEAFCTALVKELQPFMTFNGCHRLQIHTTSPIKVKFVLLELAEEALTPSSD